MKKINTDFKYLILLWIILIVSISITYAHHGNFLIDCGREAYYPTQILLGKLLYKDIFNIYGPFSYMFNALLFKVFTINLNVLYVSGCICAFFISTLIYLIAKRFLTNFLSFSIAAFTIFTGVLSTYLSNFIFPYSYAILYGLVSFLASVLFLLKYESKKKTPYLYLSSFFAGLCIANKYEFLPYFLVILYTMLKVKPLKFKQYYYTIFSLLFMPVFCFGILFLQGLAINDLISTLSLYIKMSQSQTLHYFYRRQGVYFSKNLFIYEIICAIMTIFPLSCFVYGFKVKNKISAFLLIALSAFLIIKWTNPLSFGLLPILIIIFAIYDFKNIKANFSLQILTLSAILFSIKVFWGLIIANYGTFFAGFLLITILALIIDRFRNKDLNQKAIGLYLIIVALVLGIHGMKINNHLEIKSPRGDIYTNEILYNASNDLINYINKNTKQTDSIVILPEGAMINFLTQRPTDNFYTSLIPLYVEVFGDNNLIEHFKKTKPEYIIFNNWNTNDYYFEYICQDYAVSLCNYVAANYTQEKVIDRGFRYLIFKRNK